MGDNLYRVFALLIAQVLPGLLLVFALAPHVPALQIWLGAAATADVSVGSTALVLLTSIAGSVVVSGLRFLVFERWYGIEAKCDPCQVPQAARILAAGSEAREETLHLQHYAYYQFYGSMALVWPAAVMLTLWAPVTWTVKGIGLIVAILIEYVLCASACDAMKRFLMKRAKILAVPTQRSA